MAAKLLHSLTDENPEFQIGCMTGIFQMFERQHMLSNTTKRLPPPPGSSRISSCDTSERDFNGAHPKPSSLDKYSYKNMQDRQRYSAESSRPSFSSSSRSSSFSSLDCAKATQLEAGSFDRMIFPETSSRDSATSLQPLASRQTLDLRDLVKESIYRETHGSSVKVRASEGVAVPFVYRDSPRLQSETSDGGDKKQCSPADIKESLRILAKLQEAPRYNNEARALLRSSSCHYKDGSSLSISRDGPRFSYDGNGSNSALKLKDLPRLSLDSRESSMRSVGADSKSSVLSKSMQKNCSLVQGKVQTRPPSVVAKLMGLDSLPDSVSSGDSNMGSTRSYQGESLVDESSLSEKTDKTKPVQPSSPSKNSWKEPISPRWRNSDGSVKPMSWLPLEPAPWKQNDGTRTSQKPASRSARAPANASTAFPSVYSEIEKRLGDLEFTQSGKDLRALKQILDAMQVKGLLETSKDVQGSKYSIHNDHEEFLLSSSRSVDRGKLPADEVLAITKRKAIAAQTHESPIVIMKPAKSFEKSGIPVGSVVSHGGFSSQPNLRFSESANNRKSSYIGRISSDVGSKSSERQSALSSVGTRNNRTLRTTQTSTKSQQSATDGSAGISKISGPVSPRMQQKKLELERRSRPPTPPDSSKSRKQPNKQQAESNYPGGRQRPKNSYSQKCDEQLSEVSVESRNSSSHDIEDSAESNETITRGYRNVEFNSSKRSPRATGLDSSSSKASQFRLSSVVEKNSTLMLSEEDAAEPGYVPPEYLSPVSVLDNAAYAHDSPSPIKYTGKTLKVDVPAANERDPNALERSSTESFISSSVESGSTFDYTREKLQNIDNLVQKLRRLNSSHDEARTDYIASLCENENPDHRYISEILLASGLLLRDLGSNLTDFQFHQSGNPINPELFLVLEQTKASASSKDKSTATTRLTTNEKLHRKLIFDTVNETLARKLASTSPDSKPWWGQVKLARKVLNAQNLLKELCCEIEELETKSPICTSGDEDDGWKTIFSHDVLLQSDNWMNFDTDTSGVVLDIERLVFKDLVDEIVRGESAGLTAKRGSRKPSGK
ncbi:protein LONGIFOLIA 2-like isoform X2 [Salvia hispanica]|uniref:protein LONGIFOLIA 2-like isoform X2 n=1 Tax=Salvia hispanica TaxID=49212 RepID=UPI0020090B1D|nr:protein LONGIFOLIA 2-like isoform X2 [Salvia hispanica]